MRGSTSIRITSLHVVSFTRMRGSTHIAPRYAAFGQVYPACGIDLVVFIVVYDTVGLPRMRGSTLCTVVPTTHEVVYPACGSTVPTIAGLSTTLVYPHARIDLIGEKQKRLPQVYPACAGIDL